MIHRYRSLLFLFFSASFFIAAGSVIFYTYGYRFNFERGIFVYTGSLSLKTNIKTVTVKIDNVIISEKRLGILNDSIQVSGLHPGEHFVEVGTPGYKSWNKKIVIQSGLTTEFWNIFLTEENPEQEPIPGTEQVIKMFPAPNGLFATVKKEGDRYSVGVLDIGAETDEEVFSTTEALFLPALETNIEWSPESHRLIVPLTKEGQPLYMITDIKEKTSFSLNETVGMTDTLQAPRWDATTKDFLFFLRGDTLYRLNTNTPKDTVESPAELVAEHVAAYDLSGNKLYYLSSTDGLVYEINGHGNADTPKQTTPSPVAIDTHSAYSLIVYDDTRLSVIEESTGKFILYNEKAPVPLKELGRGVKSIQYSDDGKKLLYYTENEISVYFNQAWEVQPFRAADSIIQVARFSAPIRNIQWTKDYEHVIFSLNGSVKIIELDNRDRRNMTDFAAFSSPLLQILTRFDENAIYFVSENNTAPAVHRAKFTEQTGFFGL